MDRMLIASEILAPMKSRKSVVGNAVVMDETPKELTDPSKIETTS